MWSVENIQTVMPVLPVSFQKLMAAVVGWSGEVMIFRVGVADVYSP